MKILVSGSHGLVGKALSKSLTDDGHEVVRLVRHQPAVGEPEIWWDPSEGRIDSGRLEGLEVVVHLAGESIASGRWTGEKKRAIRESRGFQPEAHVGLGRIYEEKGEHELSAREFQIAINQLADTEPIIYQILGAAHEKAGNPKAAIVAYEHYLRLAPNGSLAPAVRSIVEQLKSDQP